MIQRKHAAIFALLLGGLSSHAIERPPWAGFYDVRKNDRFKGSPLADSELDDKAKAAKAQLQAALKQFEGPRPEYFAKQYEPTKEADDPLDNGYGTGDEGKKKDKKGKKNK